MNRGRLIAFEGLDGSGKSTQLGLLGQALREAGRDVVETREPTSGSWGRRIRAMAHSGERVAAAEELRWFVEDRREHVAEVIEPSLAAGRIVLTDRYYLSTVAYQGARGLDPAQLLGAAEAEFPAPDLALVLEVAPEVGLARVAERGGPAEPAFEQEHFLAEVAAIFHGLACPYIVRLDADHPAAAVHRAIGYAVRRRLDLP